MDGLRQSSRAAIVLIAANTTTAKMPLLPDNSSYRASERGAKSGTYRAGSASCAVIKSTARCSQADDRLPRLPHAEPGERRGSFLSSEN